MLLFWRYFAGKASWSPRYGCNCSYYRHVPDGRGAQTNSPHRSAPPAYGTTTSTNRCHPDLNPSCLLLIAIQTFDKRLQKSVNETGKVTFLTSSVFASSPGARWRSKDGVLQIPWMSAWCLSLVYGVISLWAMRSVFTCLMLCHLNYRHLFH